MEDALLFGRDAAREALEVAGRASEYELSSNPMSAPPDFSIVIPVYNEQAILQAAILDLRERLLPFPESVRDPPRRERLDRPHARDRRRAVSKYPNVRFVSIGEPELRRGAARGRALGARPARRLRRDRPLRHRLPPPRARPPPHRRASTWSSAPSCCAARRTSARSCGTRRASSTMALLRVAVGFRGTDTHGLKAFRRDALLPDRARVPRRSRRARRASWWYGPTARACVSARSVRVLEKRSALDQPDAARAERAQERSEADLGGARPGAGAVPPKGAGVRAALQPASCIGAAPLACHLGSLRLGRQRGRFGRSPLLPGSQIVTPVAACTFSGCDVPSPSRTCRAKATWPGF